MARSASCSKLTPKTVFLVGLSEELMSGNTSLLSKASPIFEAMLNGELQEIGEIKIPDIEPDAFQTMLKFINGDEDGVKFLNMDHAARVCYAADKYDLQDLKRLCAEFLYPCSVDNMWLALECSVLHNIDFLKNGAMKVLCQNANEVLLSRQFLSLSKGALKAILQEDNLNINSEVDLFDAVMYWAKHQCLAEGKLFNQKNFRDVVGEIIQHIRFLTMTETEAIKCGTMVFSPDEMKIFLKHLNKEHNTQPVDFLCYSTEKREKQIACSYDYILQSIHFGIHNKPYIVRSNEISNQLLSLPSSILFNVSLHTVMIPSRISVHKNHHEFYFEEVKVTLTMNTSNRIIASGEFMGKVNYSTELEIPLFTADGSKPILLNSNHYELSLTFKSKEIHYYPLRMYSGNLIFTNLSNSITFLIGFKYAKIRI